MKRKHFFLSAFCAAAALAGFSSCQQGEEPQAPVQESLFGQDAKEWILEVKTPDDMKTRAAMPDFPTPTNCNKLWYAVYYKDALLYDCNHPDAPQPTQVGDKFTLLLKLANTVDASKVKIFFWAGHSTDDLQASTSPTTGKIKINFADRYVDVDNAYLNSNKSVAHSYTNYVQLSTTANPTNFKLSVTLKRPFASFNILSDEFNFGGVKVAYPSGIQIAASFGENNASALGGNTLLPTRWYYDTSLVTTPTKKQNSYETNQTLVYQSNSLNTTTDPRIEFKSRSFTNCGHFYFFAPPAKGFLNNGTVSYKKMNIVFRNASNASDVQFATVDLPSAGIQANNKYIIYNKQNNAGDGGGPGGFISNSYDFDIVPDSNWDDTTEIERN